MLFLTQYRLLFAKYHTAYCFYFVTTLDISKTLYLN